MILRARQVVVTLAVGVAVLALTLTGPRADAAASLPRRLSDKAFWQMIVNFSEPSGVFGSENLISNETTFQDVIPTLQQRIKPGGVYLGVGPDQNFTYITAFKPRIAFIVDIRRGNLAEHLYYKALIELSKDRADFLSRLFSRPRPAGLADDTAATALFDAYSGVEASETLLQTTLRAIVDRLVKKHGFELTVADKRSLEYVSRAFFVEGPDLRYTFPRQDGIARFFPTYAKLLMATDAAGVNHSYLASEENYRALRAFEDNNLLVPIVGDFAGPKALRAVGSYVRDHGATVDYFYTSNVEQYLVQTEAWQPFCDNVATLPLSDTSTFIRSFFDAGFFYPPGIITSDLHSVQLLDPIARLLEAVRAGEIRTYRDLVTR